MIQKNSQVVPVDKCGVWLIRVFHVYGKLRKTSIIGDFVKSSIRQTKPNN
jgi:ribosomal protein L14